LLGRHLLGLRACSATTGMSWKAV